MITVFSYIHSIPTKFPSFFYMFFSVMTDGQEREKGKSKFSVASQFIRKRCSKELG